MYHGVDMVYVMPDMGVVVAGDAVVWLWTCGRSQVSIGCSGGVVLARNE
jgi:hypothetical protein